MSFRLLTHRLFKHGRLLLYNCCTKRDIHISILERKNNHLLSSSPSARKSGTLKIAEPIFRSNSLFRFGQQARRLFVDNILNRVTPIYSADLRNEATKKFLYGDSGPLFALIGVCLASGTGLLTKDDELEGVCWEIREAVSNLHKKSTAEHQRQSKDLNLDDLNIGSPIAKGCSAVVYSAAIKESSKIQKSNDTDGNLKDKKQFQGVSHLQPPGYINPQIAMGENPLNVAQDCYQEKPKRNLSREQDTRRVHFASKSEVHHTPRSDDSSTSSTSEFAIDKTPLEKIGEDFSQYPMALKMMFNYDIQSSAMALLRAMYKETIPAIHKYLNSEADSWERSLMEQTINLPTHPNIVMMVGVFCAQVPNLMQSERLYPMALPPRINPNGYGRNMSLFLLMKRYNYSLREYLDVLSPIELTMRTRLMLFTQLLEGVTHLYRHGIAHRDLKSDNVLIDTNGNDKYPVLVLSDFGCCIADKYNGLCIPYTSMDMDKGGNTALMAPEIITKRPGTFSILDYSKSDLWACGAIAYEIFGSYNPFYSIEYRCKNNNIKLLKSASYKDEDIPPLHVSIPFVVRKLIANILQWSPNKRLTPDIAANVMQLFLWAPSSWLKSATNISTPEILQWLLSLTTKILYETSVANFDRVSTLNSTHSIPTCTEYSLLTSFLIRAQLQQIRRALEWIHQTIE